MNLEEMLQRHFDNDRQLRELRIDQKFLANDIKKQLIDGGMTEFLRVDYQRLRRDLNVNATNPKLVRKHP